MRVRLKADGRIVEILADGSERALAVEAEPHRLDERINRDGPGTFSEKESVARYSRGLRGRARLTQAEFAARIGVPIETVRNWEQGKRAPRGPARALLAVIAHAPETVFQALAKA